MMLSELWQKLDAWCRKHLGEDYDEGFENLRLSCQCTPVCLQIKKEFPEEAIEVKSGVVVLEDGSTPGEHTWLEIGTPHTDDWTIFDPTATQYHCEVVEYEACLYDKGFVEPFFEDEE
jgi:hypothetical protein